MSLNLITKIGPIAAAVMIAGQIAIAGETKSSKGLFGFEGSQAIVAERLNSKNQEFSQSSETAPKTKKKKKRKKKVRRGSFY